jgi:hypothetical protein
MGFEKDALVKASLVIWASSSHLNESYGTASCLNWRHKPVRTPASTIRMDETNRPYSIFSLGKDSWNSASG